MLAKSSSTLSPWTAPGAPGEALIDRLFNRLDGLYLHRWRSAFKGPDEVRNWREAWAAGLGEEGITADEVRRGLAACRRRCEWPPTLPEFVRLCRPAVDPKAAWLEAVGQMQRRSAGLPDTWSDPRIFWAAVKVGAFDLRGLGWEAIRTRWELALDAAGSDPVPPPRPALPSVATTTRAEAQKRLAAIREGLCRKL